MAISNLDPTNEHKPLEIVNTEVCEAYMEGSAFKKIISHSVLIM